MVINIRDLLSITLSQQADAKEIVATTMNRQQSTFPFIFDSVRASYGCHTTYRLCTGTKSFIWIYDFALEQVTQSVSQYTILIFIPFIPPCMHFRNCMTVMYNIMYTCYTSALCNKKETQHFS